MFAKIENNTVTRYPLSEQDIRVLFPNISFPAGDITPPDPYVKVWVNAAPIVSQNQNSIEISPKYENGRWIQNWQIIDLTAEEEQIKIKAAQNAKLTQLAVNRWIASQKPISYKGHFFNIDFENRMLYSRYADMNATINWKIADGVFITLDSNDFSQLVQLSEGKIQNLFNTESIWTDKIKSYTDIETINSINVDVF